MSDTFTKIHLHIVFAVKGRASIISSSWKDQLYAYITGIIQNNGHKVLAINGMKDHVHVFIGFRPNQALSELMRCVKRDSTAWINQKRLTAGKFSWQEGYGAFSYSESHIEKVIEYINNQEKHHKKKTFQEEFMQMLEAFKVEQNRKKLFEWIE